MVPISTAPALSASSSGGPDEKIDQSSGAIPRAASRFATSPRALARTAVPPF
ncbi:MAG: hypothetical protein WDN69_17135 [Aliidongia sp.]